MDKQQAQKIVDGLRAAQAARGPVVELQIHDALGRRWSLDGKRVAEAKLPRAGSAVAFSDDGSKLVVATDDKVIVFVLKPQPPRRSSPPTRGTAIPTPRRGRS